MSFIDQNKKSRYQITLKQIQSLVESEPSFRANLCNTISLLKESFNFFWIGTYFAEGNDLVLGPFQGPPACSRIPKGKGVCGKSWEEKKSFIVTNVDEFPGHISCNPRSKSEIVIPAKTKEGQLFMVLDIDSDKQNGLDQTDLFYLEKVVSILQGLYSKNIQF